MALSCCIASLAAWTSVWGEGAGATGAAPPVAAGAVAGVFVEGADISKSEDCRERPIGFFPHAVVSLN